MLCALLSLLVASAGQSARVCEGPGINHTPPAAHAAPVLSVLAYNVYLLPISMRDVPFMGGEFSAGQEERAERIPAFLAPFDVVIFSEAYDDDVRALLIEGMRAQGFRYATHILGHAYRAADEEKDRVYDQPRPFHACRESEAPPACDNAETRNDFIDLGEGDVLTGQDGGVIIVSKHPITEAREVVYGSCAGRDCRAAKGFVYARILKGDAPYHVIGTHLQFGWDGERNAARQGQLQRIRHFVEAESNIPQSEPVIIGGDLNTHRSALPSALDGDGLGAEAPTFLGHGYTRESRNDWAKRGNGYVDYVLTKKGWKEPRYAANCPMIFRTRYSFEDEGLFETVRGNDLCDLSDHYAVWGWFDFREERSAAPDCPTPVFPPG